MKETDWTKWSSIAEITGAIAIVVSLIFVGSEIRQNSAILQMSNYQTTLSWGAETGSWLKDKDFAEVYVAAINNYSELTEVQILQFDEFFGQRLNIWEFAFDAHKIGMIPENTWEAWDYYFRTEFSKSSFTTMWAESKRNDYYGEFKIYVDSALLPE